MWAAISLGSRWTKRGVKREPMKEASSLLLGHHEVSNFAIPLMFCLTTGPETMEPSDHRLKPWVKINPYWFKLFFRRYFSQQWKVTNRHMGLQLSLYNSLLLILLLLLWLNKPNSSKIQESSVTALWTQLKLINMSTYNIPNYAKNWGHKDSKVPTQQELLHRCRILILQFLEI
jgi:hypothetical protein